MKTQINEIKRMQQLAGLITESEYQESLMNEDEDFDMEDDDDFDLNGPDDCQVADGQQAHRPGAWPDWRGQLAQHDSVWTKRL